MMDSGINKLINEYSVPIEDDDIVSENQKQFYEKNSIDDLINQFSTELPTDTALSPGAATDVPLSVGSPSVDPFAKTPEGMSVFQQYQDQYAAQEAAKVVPPDDGLPKPKLVEPSVFNPATQQRIPINQIGPDQIKSDLGRDPGRSDIGTAFQYGDITTQANIQNLLSDTEGVLRDTAPFQFIQNIQNFGLPFINSVRGVVGAQPLPENAMQQASIAKEEELKNNAATLFEAARNLGFQPKSVGDIENFGDFLNWATSTVGASGAPMLVSLATAGTLSPLVLGGELDANLREIPDLDRETRIKYAYSGGIIAGVLENIGLGILVKGLPKELIGKLGTNAFAKQIQKTYGGRVAAAFTTAMSAESITEAAQEGIFIGTEALAGKDFEKGEIKERTTEALAGGALLGGPIGAIRSAATEYDDPTTTAVKDALRDLENADFSRQNFETVPVTDDAAPKPNIAQQINQPVSSVGGLSVPPTQTARTFDRPGAPPSVGQASAPSSRPNIPSAIVPTQLDDEAPSQPEDTDQEESDIRKPAPLAAINSRDDITSGLDELNQEGFEDSVAEEVYMIPRGQGMAAFDEQEEVFTRNDAESRKRQKEILKNLDEAIIDNDRSGGEAYAPLSTALRQYSTYLKDLRKNAKPAKPKAAAASEQPTISEPPKPPQVTLEQPTQPKTPTQDAPPVAQEPPVAPTVPDQPAALPNPQEAEEVGKDIDNVIKNVQTPDGQKTYNVKGKVVELSDLKQAQGELQPRDRSRKDSEVLAKERATPAKFNPSRLLDDPTTGSGSPIIGRNGTIMSGNGRVLTMQEVYANQPESLSRYRTALEEAGINTEGFSQPIFVRQLSDDMTMAELREFADLSNTEAQAQMSMTERASRDATRLIDSGIIDLYRGDFEIGALQNRDFVQEYAKKILSPTEQGAFVTADGSPSAEGLTRIRNAILASAFDDTDTLSLMLESTDDNIKAIGNAFMATAPKFAQLKKQIADGRTEAQFDITATLADMANLISRLRREGTKLQDYYNQTELFAEPDPAVKQLVRGFFNEGLTRANSTKAMKDFLTFYVDEALQKETGGLIPDETTASDIIEAGIQRTEDKRDGKRQGQGGFDFAKSSTVERDDARGEQVQKQRNARGGKSAARSVQEAERQVSDTRPERALEKSIEGVAELRNSETVTPDQSETREENTRGTKAGRVTISQSQTLRQSLYRDAFVDAGRDPDTAVNLPITRQYKILSDLVKDKFGLKLVEKPKQGAGYDQVNALLDAYHNLQWMTHTLSLPNTAIGLDGTLGLALPQRAWGGYLAAYVNKQAVEPSSFQSDVNPVTGPVILMPGRSNSFAHEWGHALDYHILDRIGADWGRGLTGRIRTNLSKGEMVYADNPPTNIVEAMGDLMNAMFFDDAAVAAEIMKMESEVARLTAAQAKRKSGKPIKKLAEMQEKLRKLREGSSKTKLPKSKYRKDAEDFATLNKSDVSYWTRPTEMFARAFEAYVARNVEAAGGNTEFITFENEAYQLALDKVAGGDDRLALTYPKDEDRMRIFMAMDRLMDQLRADVITEGTAAQAPGDTDMIDAQALFYQNIDLKKNERIGLIEDQKRAWREHQTMRTRLKNRPKRFASKWEAFQDTAGVSLINTKRGYLFNLARRYKDNPKAKRFIESIIARVATDPGSTDNRVTVQGGTYEEATRGATRRYSATFADLLDKHNLNTMSDAELQQLRLFLTSDAGVQKGADPAIKRAAGDIRNRLLNPMFDYMRKGGLNVNYLPEGGYMPRMMDTLLVIDDRDKFMYGSGKSKRGAKPLYSEVIYENEYGALDPQDAEQAAALIRLSRRKSIANLLDENTLSTAQTLSDKLTEIKLQSANPDVAEDKIQQLMEEAEPLHTELYESLRDPYGEVAAADWFERITQRQVGDISRHGVQGDFARSRKLPAEADTYMVDFYLNPVEALTQYIPGVVRKVEYEKRFGTQNVPKGERRKTSGTSIDPAANVHDYLSYASQEMASAGMKEHEIREIQYIVETVTGTKIRQDYSLDTIFNTLNTFGTMALLPRAVISSVAEPMTAAVTTGRVTDGFRVFAYALDEFATSLRGQNARERKQYYKQLGSILGVVDLPESGEIIANRVGGTAEEDTRNAARLGRFFVRTGLVGITNAQRRGSMRIGIRYLSELGDQFTNPASDRMKERAREVLQDFGVRPDDMAQFAEYVSSLQTNAKGRYDIDNIIDRSGELTDMGEILALAVQRFTDQTIQDPKIIDRPKYAETVIGRIVFGIQSFIAAFQRNVLLASMKRIQREYQNRGAASAIPHAAIKAALPLSSLFLAHTIVSSVRELILNPDKWEEETENDNLESYLLTLGLSRSGFIGRMDPLVNALTSRKYEADLSNMFVGASGAYYLKAAGRIADVLPFVDRNSPNTVSAEYQAARGVYDIVVPTALSYLATYPGFGTVAANLSGVAAAAGTSPAVKHYVLRNVIKGLYGEEYRPSRGNRQRKKTDEVISLY